MDLRYVSRETLLYGIALIMGIVLRFYNLGAVPLSELEAEWAMQALLVANPGLQTSDFAIGPQPGYVFLTGLIFTIFSSTNFLARFWPALAGSAAIVLPFLFRSALGPVAALIMAFGLAVDPGMIVASRQAGGPMMALSFALLAGGFWFIHKGKSSGTLTGLATLSGPSIFTGMISIAISNFLTKIITRRIISITGAGEDSAELIDASVGQDNEKNLPDLRIQNTYFRWFLLSGGIAVIVVGTYFLQYPQGLVAWYKTIPAYLSGWINPSGTPAVHLILALFVFELLALVFGIVGVTRWIFYSIVGQKQNGKLFLPLFLWLMAALLILLIYPARQVSGLVWVLVPLWAAASLELERYIPTHNIHPVSIVLAVVVFVLCTLFWNALIVSEHILVLFSAAQIGIRLALIAGVIAIGTLSVLLVSVGWSWYTSKRGLVWGILTALLIYTFSVMWGAAQIRQNDPAELWYPTPGTGQVNLLKSTIEDISSGYVGFPDEIQLISTVTSPAMRWSLRGFKNALFVPVLPTEGLPPLIITKQVDNIPVRGVEHRGQDFIWLSNAMWNGAYPGDFLSWYTFRDIPLEHEMVILWVRSNLFPDDAQEPVDDEIDKIQ